MKLAKDYPIRLVCRLLDVPRSSLYYATRAAEAMSPNETMPASLLASL